MREGGSTTVCPLCIKRELLFFSFFSFRDALASLHPLVLIYVESLCLYPIDVSVAREQHGFVWTMHSCRRVSVEFLGPFMNVARWLTLLLHRHPALWCHPSPLETGRFMNENVECAPGGFLVSWNIPHLISPLRFISLIISLDLNHGLVERRNIEKRKKFSVTNNETRPAYALGHSSFLKKYERKNLEFFT